MTHIPPTIGRVLLFHPREEVAGVVYDVEQPFNASVCFVHHDRLINIAYNDHRGLAYTAQSVILVQDGDAIPEGQAYCTWMAYQIGQAAKLEQVVGQALANKEPIFGGPDAQPRQDMPAGTMSTGNIGPLAERE